MVAVKARGRGDVTSSQVVLDERSHQRTEKTFWAFGERDCKGGHSGLARMHGPAMVRACKTCSPLVLWC